MATIHIVPHTHWDREWYLTLQAFRVRLIHLMDLLLDILASEPDFLHFTLDGQTIIVQDYLEVRPERRDELLGHIRSGRILVGPWYVLPDEFLVSPEALVRNLLRGAADCSLFGKRMEVGYLPDPFGQIGQLPQILRSFGLESAVFRRGLADESCELWWEAADGSKVLVSYLRDSYDNASQLPTSPDAFAAFIAERRDSLRPHCRTSHLLLMNGTDHQEPQPLLPSLLASARLDGDTLLISTLPTYMSQVQAEINSRQLDLPLIHGELRNPKRHHLVAGTLSSRTWIKQRNHQCETLLEKWAEPWAAWAELLLGQAADHSVWTGHLTIPRVRKPQALLHHAWQLLLQCHPHDSICGCSVDQVHEEMRPRFDQSEQIAEEVTRQSLVAVSSAIDARPLSRIGARSALVIFNPLQQPMSGLTHARLELPAGLDPFEVVDEAGNSVPFRLLHRKARCLADLELDQAGLRGMLEMVQGGRALGLSIQSIGVVKGGDHTLVDVVLAENAEANLQAVSEGHTLIESLLRSPDMNRFHLVARLTTEVSMELLAPPIPGHGYRLFGLKPAGGHPPDVRYMRGHSIAHQDLRLDAEKDGSLTLTDLRTKTTFSGLLRFADQGDRGDSYTFCPVENDQPLRVSSRQARIRRLETPCWQAIEIQQTFLLPERLTDDRRTRSSSWVELPVTVQATLIPGVPRVDLDIQVDNRAMDHRLQVHFPLPFPAQHAHCGGHFEVVSRSTLIPQATQEWIESPSPEGPVRNFIAAHSGGKGLMVALRGLREASVSPEGVMAVTLLRCFGWLSQDDLATRKGGAGPSVPTPGGQMLGQHHFQLSLVPYDGDLIAAWHQAEAFQTGLRATGVRLQDGRLPAIASLLRIEPPAFALTAVKMAEDGKGLIVRGVNLSSEPQQVLVECLLPLMDASLTRMDEQVVAGLVPRDERSLGFEARPGEIVTLRLMITGWGKKEQ